MAIIQSCCCWKSLRTGSLACGIYSLIYYTILVVAGTFHVESWGTPFDNNTVAMSIAQDNEVALPVSIAIVICSMMAIIASVVLLFGLRMENRLLLIPWVIIITVTTLVDFVYTVYSIGTTVIYPVFATIVTVDFFICLLNVYCILCVVSQYQEYKAGRGTKLHDLQLEAFNGPVQYFKDGTKKQFVNGNLQKRCKRRASYGIVPPVQSTAINHRTSQPSHDRHQVSLLDPISECSNVDEVPLNGSGVLTCTDEIDRTSDSNGRNGGPRCQPPPPRLDAEQDSAVTGNGSDVSSTRRVKFGTVLFNSMDSVLADKNEHFQ